jgi:hypothetical protein
MKYLKTFENNTQLNKYTVVRQGRDKFRELMVLELLEIKKFETKFKRIYTYYCTTKRLYKTEEYQYGFLNDSLKDLVIYTSDDLDKILNLLPALDNSNKYNL